MEQMATKVLGALFSAAIILSMASLMGCTSAAALRGEPGMDIGTLKPGMARSEVEAVLGSPLREWTTPSNIRYRIYRYDAGVPPSQSEAATMVFINVISLGLFELYEATGVTDLSHPSKDDMRRVWRQIAISYDADERVVALFHDFSDLDVLPDNGRPEGP